MLTLFANFMSNQELMYAAHFFIQFFDWFLIIPGAIGSLITGMWLSIRISGQIGADLPIIIGFMSNSLGILQQLSLEAFGFANG